MPDEASNGTRKAPDLFICHTGLDEAYVTDLAAKLEAHGVRCWYYERDNNGESIGSAVDKALSDSSCLLFVMSKNLPVASQYVQNELNDFVRTKRKIIPLRVSMPQSFWPDGSRSLIGAIPVVEDSSGIAKERFVAKVLQKVPGHLPQPRQKPSSDLINAQGKREPCRKWHFVNVTVVVFFVCLIFVVARLSSRVPAEPTPNHSPISLEEPGSHPPKHPKGPKHREQTNSLMDVRLPGGISMFFRRCPSGQFVMGSPEGEEGHQYDEMQRTVIFTNDFWIGETEVTQAQWYHVMDGQTIEELAAIALSDDTEYFGNGSIRKTLGLSKDSDPATMCKGVADEMPVYWVGKTDAERFCRRLTAVERAEGHIPEEVEYRLPTEEEWEYACRAGTQSALPNGLELDLLGVNNSPNLDAIAWYGGNAGLGLEGEGWNMTNWPEKQYDFVFGSVHEVREKEPNNWGLYDMIGNVWEWCCDGNEEDHDATDVRRGGGWSSFASLCRSASRVSGQKSRVPEQKETRYHDIGFRVVLAPRLPLLQNHSTKRKNQP